MSVVTSPSQLWAGGGATGAPSHARRVRHRTRTVLSEHPRLYLPLARRRYPGPSPRVVGPDTEAVIDGYTRSASTFAVYAFQLAQPRSVPLAHHLHAPAQLMEAARRGLPTIMVVREPRGAVLSQMVREPDVDLLDALFAYQRFHHSLMPHRDAFLVADFPEVTQRFGDVVRRTNIKFGTDFGVFNGTEAELAECRRMVDQRPTLSPVLLGFESGEVTLEQARAHLACLETVPAGDPVWAPSVAREQAKTALQELWCSPRVAAARAAAEAAYRAFLDRP